MQEGKGRRTQEDRAKALQQKQPDEDPVLLDPTQNKENLPENLVDPRGSTVDGEQAGQGEPGEGEGWVKMG